MNGFIIVPKDTNFTERSDLQDEHQLHKKESEFKGRSNDIHIKCISCNLVLPSNFTQSNQSVHSYHQSKSKACEYLAYFQKKPLNLNDPAYNRVWTN